MAADSRVFEGATGLLHTLAFTALCPGLLGLSIPSTAGPGVTPALRTHCSIQTVLILLRSPRPDPFSLLSLHLPKSHPSQFSKSQCKTGSYQVFMEDPCHIVLAK